MIKRVLSILLACLFILAFTACQGSTTTSNGPTSTPSTSDPGGSVNNTNKEDVRIKVALFDSGASLSQGQKAVFEAFTAENPNIIPEFQFITSDSYGGNWNGYIMKIQTMIASGNAPDVAALGLEGVGMLAMNNLALPIDDYIAGHQDELSEIMGGIDKELLEIFRVDGKLYGIPYEANSVVTHIRKDIFQKAGVGLPSADWTIDDLKEISAKISDPDNGVYAFGVPTNFFCLQALLYSNGASPLNDDWTAAMINSDKSVEVFQFLQDAIYKHKWAPEPNDNITDVELIVQGRTAMGWWGRWPTKDYAASDLYDKFYFQNVPAWGDGHTTCAGSASFVVMSSTKHPEEAKKVATWCAGREYVNAFLSTGSLPSNSIFGAEICAKDGVVENWESMYDVYKLGQWRRSQDPPEYADLANIYSKYMDIIYSNQMPAKQALDKAADEINLMLKNSEYRDTAQEMKVIESLFKN